MPINKFLFMKKIVHIIPVGHTKRTLIEGMRQFPFHKIILVLGREKSPGEEKAKKVALEIEKELKEIAEIEYLHVDVDDVYSTAQSKKMGITLRSTLPDPLERLGSPATLGALLPAQTCMLPYPHIKMGKSPVLEEFWKYPAFHC
jgi:hypothetical protein